MKQTLRFVLFICFIILFQGPQASISASIYTNSKAYSYNPYVDPEFWNTLAPHFLPENHPIKIEMDRIFVHSKRRVTKSSSTLKKADFTVLQKGASRHPFVVAHPNLPGYLLKIYLEGQNKVSFDERHLDRVLGSLVAQETINKYGFESMIKVPRKWIYPLPLRSSSSRKEKKNSHFVLVVEDMNLVDEEKNQTLWKSPAMTPDLLRAICILINEVGLSDSVLVFNIPFSLDGKIAVIDTEWYHNWPVSMHRLSQFLSPAMKEYLKMLIETEMHFDG